MKYIQTNFTWRLIICPWKRSFLLRAIFRFRLKCFWSIYIDVSLGLRDIQRANNHIQDRTWISADKTVKMSIDSTHQVASSKPNRFTHAANVRFRRLRPMLRCQLFLPYWLGLSTGARQSVRCYHCNGWGRDRVDHHSILGRVEGVSERTSQFYTLESSYDLFVVFWWFWSKFSPLMPGLEITWSQWTNCRFAPTRTTVVDCTWHLHLPPTLWNSNGKSTYSLVCLFTRVSSLTESSMQMHQWSSDFMQQTGGRMWTPAISTTHFQLGSKGCSENTWNTMDIGKTWTFQCLKLMLSWRHKFKTPNVQRKFAQRYTLWATHIENEVSIASVLLLIDKFRAKSNRVNHYPPWISIFETTTPGGQSGMTCPSMPSWCLMS